MQAVEEYAGGRESGMEPEGRSATRFDIAFEAWRLPSFMLLGFLIPLKLSLSLICLFILLGCWLVRERKTIRRALLQGWPFSRPMLVFGLVALLLSPFGIAPGHSIAELLLFIYPLFLIPLFAGLQTRREICLVISAIILGQLIAALHSYIDAMIPLGSLFIGKVTESGQLAVTIPLAMAGLLLSSDESEHPHPFALPLWGVILTTLLLATCAFTLTGESTFMLQLLAIGAGVALPVLALRNLLRAWRERRIPPEEWLAALASIALPLLLAALLVNLKRGPWFGVILASTALLAIYARSRLAIFLAALIAIPLLFPTISARLLASGHDFVIAGGRSEMWEIGTDLLHRYPLGIGFANIELPMDQGGRFLHLFSSSIPPELRHLHSTPLQTFVELGGLGIAVLAWWILAVLQAALRSHPHSNAGRIARGIGAGLISWCVVGLFEYNLGDKEVAMLLFACVGLLAALVPGKAGTTS